MDDFPQIRVYPRPSAVTNEILDMTQIQIYDTTLRDGAQGEGVNFSLQDKLLIARRLDEFGFDFVEGGYPLSNPKDAEFFQRVAAEPLKHSRVCAFGMTRRKGVRPADDLGMKALLDSQAPVITIVGKTHDFHVTDVLRVSLEVLGVHVYPDMFSLAQAHEALEANGVRDPTLAKLLEKMVAKFLDELR